MKLFRVLVVDDKEIVLDRIQREIHHKVKILDDEWKIEINTLYVNVGGDDKTEQYFIKDETIENLGKISSKPFDLILLDFGYKMEGSPIIENTIKKYDMNFRLKHLDGKLLNPSNLIETSLEVCNRKKMRNYLKNINKNFINHCGDIIIYTYIPPSIKIYVPSTALRENITFDSFPSSNKIELLDTSLELFNDEEFTKDHYKEKYYSYLIAKYLDKLIHLKISEKSIINSRFIKVRNTSKSVGFIILVGGLIGAISEYIGSMIIRLFENMQIIPAILLILFTISIVILSGRILINFVEKRLKKLFVEEDQVSV